MKYNYYILTGDPGVGKTTLVKKAVSLLRKNIKTYGFYTEEVRSNRCREGFDVVTLDGARCCLARDQILVTNIRKPKVGKYVVFVEDFENIVLPCIEEKSDEPKLLVIDEVGKMEFHSEAFKRRISQIFSPSSNSIVLATIPNRMSHPIIEMIRNNSRSKVWTVTTQNRNNLLEEITNDIQARCLIEK